MTDLSEKILKTIEDKKIEPRPKWQFVAKDFTLWILAGLSLVFGSIASSMVFLNLTDNARMPVSPCLSGADLPFCHETAMHWFMLALPYAWLITFGLFVAVLYYNIKHLKKAYRYPVWMLALGALLGSIFIGSLLSLAGLHRRMNKELSSQSQFYGAIFDPRIKVWQRPDSGFVAGKASNVKDGSFDLEDFRKETWHVSMSQETKVDSEAGNISEGDAVKVVGVKKAGHSFEAKEIGVWDLDDRRPRPAQVDTIAVPNGVIIMQTPR